MIYEERTRGGQMLGEGGGAGEVDEWILPKHRFDPGNT